MTRIKRNLTKSVFFMSKLCGQCPSFCCAEAHTNLLPDTPRSLSQFAGWPRVSRGACLPWRGRRGSPGMATGGPHSFSQELAGCHFCFCFFGQQWHLTKPWCQWGSGVDPCHREVLQSPCRQAVIILTGKCKELTSTVLSTTLGYCGAR